MGMSSQFCRVVLVGVLSACSHTLLGSTSSSLTSATPFLDIYHQGKRSNCGSVAMTKLILSHFGVSPSSGPFSRIPIEGVGFSLVLMDGSKVIVTSAEWEKAAAESKFEPSSDSGELKAANALYAAMAVRRAGKNDGREIGVREFKRALRTLGSGGDLADADVLPFLLGFKEFIEPRSPKDTFEVYLIGSGRHIAFAAGQKYDEHGEKNGEDITSFNKYYGTATMYRYALAGDGDQMIRQCSDGAITWTPSNAVWRSCKVGEVTELQRK